LFSGERWIQHQRTREEERNPKKTWPVSARFSRRRLERKAEKDDYDEREYYSRGQKLARSEFEPKLFGKQDRGRSGGRHSNLPALYFTRCIMLCMTKFSEQRPGIASRSAIALDAPGCQ
jgi:hypothetical protein